MRILADENIPCSAEAFSCFGEVVTTPGRSITRSQLDGIDALLVRSVTHVNADLIDGTSVRFVGSATSGLDHIDEAYLESAGIHFTHAQGANARSVAEYVLAAIIETTDDLTELSSLRCGIIGFGHVGREVYELLAPLDIQCVAVDPLIPKPERGPDIVSLKSAEACDILTFHVPLTHTGEHPTQHMINAALLTALPQNALLINASRGGVHSTSALLHAKRMQPSLRLVLDVFEHEPTIDAELARVCAIATPHIAGYSWDAKLEGTRRMFDALARWTSTNAEFPSTSDAPSPPISRLKPPESIGSLTAELRHAVRQVYDIHADDRALREGIADEQIIGSGNIGGVFDRLRKSYGPRREFSAVRGTPKGWSSGASAKLSRLGFVME